MKKFIVTLLVSLLVLSSFGCGKKSTGTIEGSLSTIMDEIIDTVDVDDETKEYVLDRLNKAEVPDDQKEYFFGTTDIEYEEAFSAEPLINAQAFSLVLVKAKDADAANKLKESLLTTVNPNKWICVSVDESQVKTSAVGNIVLLVMAENADKYISAFEALAK